MTLIANANRNPKKTPVFKIEDFDPYEKNRRAAPIKGSISDLKIFVQK